MAEPLYVLKNQTKFVQEKKHQNFFNDLKRVLISLPILAFLETEGEFILDTDEGTSISNERIDAVLLQKQNDIEGVIDILGGKKFVAFFPLDGIKKTPRTYSHI